MTKAQATPVPDDSSRWTLRLLLEQALTALGWFALGFGLLACLLWAAMGPLDDRHLGLFLGLPAGTLAALGASWVLAARLLRRPRLRWRLAGISVALALPTAIAFIPAVGLMTIGMPVLWLFYPLAKLTSHTAPLP